MNRPSQFKPAAATRPVVLPPPVRWGQVGPAAQRKSAGTTAAVPPPPVYWPTHRAPAAQPKIAAAPRAVLPPPVHWPGPMVRPLQQKVASPSAKAPPAASRARTVQLASSAHPSQTENMSFKVGTHKCTGYNPYHLDTNPRPKHKGQDITKAPQAQLDKAVAAINTGQAIYVGTDGRNDYVVYNGYRYGIHKQVFEGKRQLFPDAPLSSSSSQEPRESVEHKSKEDLDEGMTGQPDEAYPSKEPIFVVGLNDAPIVFEGLSGAGKLAFGTRVRPSLSLTSLPSTQLRIVVLNGPHVGKYGTVERAHVTEMDY